MSEHPMPAGPAMTPSAVVIMGSSQTRQRRFGELLFPEPSGQAEPKPPAARELPGEPEPAPSSRRSVVPRDLPRKLAIAGAVVAGLSFLLPWADLVLGGASASGGYLSHWGLANVRNILLVMGLFAVGWLAWLPMGRLAWLRLGVLPIVAGAALLGIVWPYLTGDYGARLGMWISILGAGLLIGAGILAIAERASDEVDDQPI